MSEETTGRMERGSNEYENEEWLQREYADKCRTTTDIADQFGVSHSAVSYYTRKYELQHKYKNAKWLDEKFNKEGWTVEEIVEECNKARTTITSWLGRNGVEYR